METPTTVTTLSLPPNTSPSPPVTVRLISEPPLTCSGPPRSTFITWAFPGVGAPACPQAPISLGRLVRRRAADGPLRCRPPLAMPGEPGSGRAGSQLTACSTSAAILASSAAVGSFSAKAIGHMAPSSRFAVSLKPSVAYLVLNFCAGWKKQTILPSLAYAGIPYQVLGERSGALALTRAWIRSARARSGSVISAIFASTSLSPSALAARGPRRAAVFSSWPCSFIAACSSSVNPWDTLPVVLSAGFCVSVIERFPSWRAVHCLAPWFAAVVTCGDPLCWWWCSCVVPPGSARCGLPREPVRVGEGPGVAANDDPVRAGAVRGDAGVFGGGTAAVERQPDGRRRGVELDVLAAEALRHGQAAVEVELLGRLDALDPEQQHEVVDLPGGRAGVLLRRRRDLPDRSARVLDDTAVAPKPPRGRLEYRRAAGEGGADEAVDGTRLGHHQRKHEPAEAGRRCLRGAEVHLVAQTERGGVEGLSSRGVGDFEGDGFDVGHRNSFSRGGLSS